MYEEKRHTGLLWTTASHYLAYLIALTCWSRRSHATVTLHHIPDSHQICFVTLRLLEPLAVGNTSHRFCRVKASLRRTELLATNK